MWIRRVRVVLPLVVVLVVVATVFFHQDRVLSIVTQALGQKANPGVPDRAKHPQVLQLHIEPEAPGAPGADTADQSTRYKFSLFRGGDVGMDMGRCSELKAKKTVAVGPFRDLTVLFGEFVPRHVGELRRYEKLMAHLLAEQVTTGQFDGWFHFAGAAVWDDELGANVMVLRVMYSKEHTRRRATFSVLYVQAYDGDWKEVETAGSRSFPYILPIEFELGKDQLGKDQLGKDEHEKGQLGKGQLGKGQPGPDEQGQFGPEDPRTLMVAHQGKKVPAVVFNMKLGDTRAMYMAKLWEGKPVRLAADGVSRKTEKNWTPFVVASEPELVFFVYRWEHMQVLKCSWAGQCLWQAIAGTAGKNNAEHTAKAISAFRGGTPLVQVGPNQWLGFIRAHLVDCGCGFETYRPNMVVVALADDGFCLLEISPYVHFGIPLTAWDGSSNVCAAVPFRPNALIPNGIDGAGDTWRFFYSVNDNLVAMTTLKGLEAGPVQCSGGSNLYCALGELYQECSDYYFRYGTGAMEEEKQKRN